MEELMCWGKPICEVLKQLRIPFSFKKEPIRNARLLFFKAKTNSVEEELARVLWRHFIFKELQSVSSFKEALSVYSETRLMPQEKTEVFDVLLSFVSTKEEAITVYQCASKNTLEHIRAETKLAEFE